MVLVKTFFSSWCLYTCRLKGKLMRARVANLSVQFMLKLTLLWSVCLQVRLSVEPSLGTSYFGVTDSGPDVFPCFLLCRVSRVIVMN